MVRVVIIHDTLGKIKGFKVSGHAGYDVSGKEHAYRSHEHAGHRHIKDNVSSHSVPRLFINSLDIFHAPA